VYGRTKILSKIRKEDYMQANTHRKGKGYLKVHYISKRDSAHKLSLYRSAHQKLNKRPKI
jgi:hypothetical protein